MNSFDLKRFALSIVYTNRCAFCDEFIQHNKFYCSECGENLPLLPLEVTGNFIGVCQYSGIVEGAVWQLKNHNNGYVVDTFGKMIYDRLAELGIIEDISLILPVPVSRKRLYQRGYNQAYLMAKVISQLSKIPVGKRVIFAKEHKEQKLLSADKRRQNVRNSYYIRNTQLITGKNILLVDDVSTTGSTLSYISKLLKEGGAESVYTTAFAKTIKGKG